MSSEKRIIHLHIPSELGYEKVAMGAARSVAQAMGFSNDRILDLQTAIAEACTNAMEHGNRLNAAQRVEVVLTVEENALAVDVNDKGKNPQFGEPEIREHDKHRGMGMYIIKQLVDEVQWSAKPQGGQVRMVIYLEPKEEAGA
ncbi:MAG TPA: ATP-binding protein [Chloroflexia bacterium]|nr:ATP-binding protein [Chloroflexia bacterium]